MKLVGKRSISSVLSMLLKVSLIGCGIALGLVISIYFMPEGLLPDHSISVEYGALKIDLGEGLQFTPRLIISLSAVVVVLMYVLFQLQKLFANFANELIFSYDNAARLRRAGLATLVLSAVYPFLDGAVASQVHNYLVQRGIEATAIYQLNPVMIFAGLLVLVLAEVFRIATGIAEEHKLTI